MGTASLKHSKALVCVGSTGLLSSLSRNGYPTAFTLKRPDILALGALPLIPQAVADTLPPTCRHICYTGSSSWGDGGMADTADLNSAAA
jgi:hypothetical protein